MKKILAITFVTLTTLSCNQVLFDPPEPIILNESTEFEETTDEFRVNLAEVTRVAEQFAVGSGLSINATRSVDLQTFFNQFGEPAMYALNFQGGGFIVVSAIKDLQPILAFNTTGRFEYNENLAGLDQWMSEVSELTASPSLINPDSAAVYRKMWEQYEKVSPFVFSKTRDWKPGEIDPNEWAALQSIFMDSLSSWNAKNYNVYTLGDLPEQYSEQYDIINEMAFNSIWPEYQPKYLDLTFIVERTECSTYNVNMIKTSWGQQNGFNQSFPAVGSLTHAYAGCGPVAIGQVMYSYESPSYLNWDDMPTNYGTKTTSDFLLDIATIGGATYTETGTSISGENFKSVFNHFGYHAEYSNFNQSSATSDLENGHPVILIGNRSNGEHAYILSGYGGYFSKTILEVWSFPDVRKFRVIYQEENPHFARSYYINWGWNGYSDGSYADISSMKTSDGSVYTAKKMVYQIYPNN